MKINYNYEELSNAWNELRQAPLSQLIDETNKAISTNKKQSILANIHLIFSVVMPLSFALFFCFSQKPLFLLLTVSTVTASWVVVQFLPYRVSQSAVRESVIPFRDMLVSLQTKNLVDASEYLDEINLMTLSNFSKCYTRARGLYCCFFMDFEPLVYANKLLTCNILDIYPEQNKTIVTFTAGTNAVRTMTVPCTCEAYTDISESTVSFENGRLYIKQKYSGKS